MQEPNPVQAAAHNAHLNISAEEARTIASLLRYVVSLNTTAGLIQAERRLATPTYRAIELAASVLEGQTFTEAVETSTRTWTGSLTNDHRRALETLQQTQKLLRASMTGQLTPDQLAEYLEITQEQFEELLHPRTGKHPSQ